MTNTATTPETEAALHTMLSDVVEGLSQNRKTLPSKYFYDERGSKLFDDICELDEYYVTRTETALIQQQVGDIAAAVGSNALLVEYGSGSSLKTRLLLRNLIAPAGYVPIDISGDYLSQVGHSLQAEFPHIEIMPVVADFTKSFEVPSPTSKESRRVIYFPGSTIGNFRREDAMALLVGMAENAGAYGGVLIGVDLDKDRDVLRAAYNDSQGVTAEFNLNVLKRINDELGGTFDLSKFKHEAVFNDGRSCIEMHLISTERQTANVCKYSFEFEENESVLTEYSHKYTIHAFGEMANEAGLNVKNVWTDANNMFAVMYLERA
ncbi:MAG: L-histidine N(alpha)-methyltransferase [Chloroflexi bacterium]|nr:L-histidine N(alpha)-methyltransferase [Chloroflexota bacterium]MDA1281126.1 L-histidine N(alpha)-methyltransferase [Chloroflexota bacterium]